MIACSTLAVLTLAACGSTGSGVTAGRSDQLGATGPDVTEATNGADIPADTAGPPATDGPLPTFPAPEDLGPPPGGGLIDFGQDHVAKSYDNYLDRAFVDITNFWTTIFPQAYGSEFTPVNSIYAHSPERPDAPQCDGDVPYEAVQGNAFFAPCGDGTTIIVYDDDELFPELVDQFGAFSLAVIAAHEYGHTVSSNAGTLGRDVATIDKEQQADCFAGAWVAHVVRGESDLLQFGDDEIKGGIAAMISYRDPVGFDSANDPSGHGSGFDRVGAFQDGFISGPSRCADYPNNPNPRVDLVFLDQDDANSGGNMPLTDIEAAMPITLGTFWRPTLEAAGIAFTTPTFVPFPHDGPYPTCDGRTPDQLQNRGVFCADTNTIAYDNDYANELYDLYGDLSYAYPIATGFSDAVQAALQFPLTGETKVLLDDCLVGAWLRDIVPKLAPDGTIEATNPNQELLLSAGDLDEVLSTAILEGDASTSTDIRGTAFEKIDAFRAGVIGGLPGCQSLLD